MLNNFFEHRHNVLNHCNFAVSNEYVWVAENSFHFIRIGHHVRRNVAAVKLHTFYSFQAGFHSFGFFNSDNAVITDFFHSICDQTADFFITSGDRSNLSFCALSLYFLGYCFQFLDKNINCGFDTFFDYHRVSAGSNVFHTFTNHCLCQNGCCSSTIASYVISFGSNFFNQLSAHVFKSVFEINIAGNCYTVISNSRSAEFLLQYDIAAFRSQCYFYCISQCINAAFKSTTCFFIK